MADDTFYIVRTKDGMLELRQTRFRGKPSHPHDVCGVASTIAQMREIAALLGGSVDWSRVEALAQPPSPDAESPPRNKSQDRR